MLKKFLRICSMALVIVLLVNMLPAAALASEFQKMQSVTSISPDPASAQAENAAQKATIVEELTDKRTEYTKEYLLSDGTHVAAVYADAVHFQKSGKWEEIDNTLKSVGLNAKSTYVNTAGPWQVTFPKQMGSSGQITITKDGYTLSFGMAGKLSHNHDSVAAKAAVDGNAEAMAVSAALPTAAKVESVDLRQAKSEAKYEQLVQEKLYAKLSYANVYADTDVVYDLQSNKVKESVILSRYDSTLRGYRYSLNAGGMTPVLDEYGNIDFYDADGKNIVMSMPAPFMVDSNDAYSFDIQVQLTGSGSNYTLTYLLPQKWLADSSRAFPVVLDPVVSAGTGVNNIADQTVASRGNLNYTWSRLECGLDTSVGAERFFVAFTSLPSLGSSDVIVDATVSLYKPVVSNSPFYVGVHRVNGTWSSSTINWSNMPTLAADVATAMDSNRVTSTGWYQWDVTSLAQEWYATGRNTGMMFRTTDAIENGSTNHWSQFYSSDNGPNAPTLTIEYRTITDVSFGSVCQVDITSAYEKKYFTFTPTRTDFYTFESIYSTGDPYIWLYNADEDLLTVHDDVPGSYRVLIAGASTLSSVDTTSISWGDTVSTSCTTKLVPSIYAFTPQESGEYLFYSNDATGDPIAWLYNSSLSQIGYNDDGAAYSYNFRLVATLEAFETYYFVAMHTASKIGQYKFHVYRTASIETENYHIRNLGNDAYVDINDMTSQEFAYLHDFRESPQSKWTIQKQADGYYTIRSNYGDQKYIGIENANVFAYNIKLYSSISNATKWKIFCLPDGTMRFEPKNAAGKLLYAGGSAGSKLSLVELGRSLDYRTKWTVARKVLSYVNYYDASFERNTTLIQNISLANDFADAVYRNQFGVSIYAESSPTRHTTALDECLCGFDEPCTDGGCGDVCQNDHHKNIYRISDDLYVEPREDDHLYVLWTDRKRLDTQTNEEKGVYCKDIIGNHTITNAIACVIDHRPVIHFLRIVGSTQNQREACMALVLVHETAHTLGMPDVYDTTGHCDGDTDCVMGYYDPIAATQMYKDVINNHVSPFCSSCQERLRRLNSNINIFGNQ